MSQLANKVARLDRARAQVRELELDLARELNLPAVQRLPPPSSPAPVPSRKQWKRVAIAPAIAEQIRQKRASGKTREEIAKDLGVSVSTVIRYTSKKLPGRRRHRQDNPDTIAAVIAPLGPGETHSSRVKAMRIGKTLYWQILRSHKKQ